MREAVQTTLCVIVAFFLALRVVAQPVVLASPEPGVMALCTGSEIVYISISGQDEPGQDTNKFSDPCPFFGVTAFAPANAAPSLSEAEGIAQARTPIASAQVKLKRTLYTPGPRAPPVPI